MQQQGSRAAVVAVAYLPKSVKVGWEIVCEMEGEALLAIFLDGEIISLYLISEDDLLQ